MVHILLKAYSEENLVETRFDQNELKKPEVVWWVSEKLDWKTLGFSTELKKTSTE